MIKKSQNSFSYEELISCAKGEMFGLGNPQLPLPPMLMTDRITSITEKGGFYNKGYVEAEFDVNPELWFFSCHFENDPVMPGCLGLDGLWQLLGFYLGWLGGKGKGRAISVGEVKFSGQILPESKLLKFKLNIKRVMMSKLILGIADGNVYCDDTNVFEAKNIRVGLFISNEN